MMNLMTLLGSRATAAVFALLLSAIMVGSAVGPALDVTAPAGASQGLIA